MMMQNKSNLAWGGGGGGHWMLLLVLEDDKHDICICRQCEDIQLLVSGNGQVSSVFLFFSFFFFLNCKTKGVDK